MNGANFDCIFNIAVVSRKTLLLFLLKRRINRENKHKKSAWVRKLFEQRKTKGEFYLLVQYLLLFDEEFFFEYFRMTSVQYEEVLTMVAPEIQKLCITRECIGPSERLLLEELSFQLKKHCGKYCHNI